MKEYDKLTPELEEFVKKQHVFWVATAPSVPDGHVNVSPKGLHGTFQFISPENAILASKGAFTGPAMTYFAYCDIGGSGIETHAHLQQQSKSITVCFCAFEGAPMILRFFGKGVSIEPGEKGFNEVLNEFESQTLDDYKMRGNTPVESRLRNIVIVEVHRIRDSCGFGVPFLKYEEDRTIFKNRAQTVENEARLKRRRETNAVSIDGLPGLRWVQAELDKSTKAVTQKPSILSSLSINNAIFFVAGVAVTLAAINLRKMNEATIAFSKNF